MEACLPGAHQVCVWGGGRKVGAGRGLCVLTAPSLDRIVGCPTAVDPQVLELSGGGGMHGACRGGSAGLSWVPMLGVDVCWWPPTTGAVPGVCCSPLGADRCQPHAQPASLSCPHVPWCPRTRYP